MPLGQETLADLLNQELQLPEVDPDACVHSLLDQANCRACVETCPTQAWILDDEVLGLDTEACDGCGLCVPECPSGALHVHYPWVIRPFGGRMIALFACDKSQIKEDGGRLPCVHALGLRQLLLLHNAGIEYLLASTADCAGCPRNTTNGIHKRLDQLNVLLTERHKPPMKLLQRSDAVWMKLFRTEEMVTRGTQLSRRRFLQGSGEQLREQLVVLDPLNMPESRTIPPGQLLPASENSKAHWPWSPALDESRCNGCDACMKLCPTQALQIKSGEEDTLSYYELEPAKCNGCGICEAACDAQAITVKSLALSSSVTVLPLAEYRCQACGNPFHSLQSNPQTVTLCPICQKQNHSSNLFQVLVDE